MDWEQTIVLAGGIIGGLICLACGIAGIYFSVKNTNGPRERTLMMNAGTVCCVAIFLFLWLMSALPDPYRYLLWIPYSILLPLGIVYVNRVQIRVREKEASDGIKTPAAAETKIEDTFAALIDRLKQDGLIDEANTLDFLLRKTAWTTGSEFLGEFGLAMKKIKNNVGRSGSAETKAAFKASAKAIGKVWPQMFWW